jgi:alpha-beta hydrolase superfamily lysophospholipase
MMLPDDLDAYLAAEEARHADLRPGTEKRIAWADPARPNPTRLAVVYLHGFAATRQETAPLAERVAQVLHANLYEARLTGHGRGPAALAEARLEDWLDDVDEARAIAHRLGDRTVLIGTSTGATLALLWALDGSEDLAACVLISPNLGPRDRRAELMNWPLARYFAPLVQGRSYGWTPVNSDHARLWTTRFPVRALVPMAAAVKKARRAALSRLRPPTLVLYSPRDQVVNPRRIEHFYARLRMSRRALVAVHDSDDPGQHVLAGDILSPSTTERLARLIVEFVTGSASHGSDRVPAATSTTTGSGSP